MNKYLILIVIASLVGCSGDEHPSYDQIKNTIPIGGETIIYNPDTSLEKITAIQQQLTGDNRKAFDSSLSWYGTESAYGLDKIHNKTAHQLVTIVNCLKVTPRKKQDTCFN